MQSPTLAAQAHQVFGHGLDLFERLERGDRADFGVEHGRLRKLLWADGEVAADPEYAGAVRPAVGGRGTVALDPNTAFLGARYALACWLDELFIESSPWGALWAEAAMEVEVVGTGTQERGWRFWRQARKAAMRPGTDALEVYLWCVMLGFRGAPADEGVDPAKWADQTRDHIIKTRNQQFPYDAGVNPRPDVPVLGGRRAFARAVRVATAAAAAAAFAVGYRLLK